MEQVCKDLKIPTRSNRVDIGVRVELPAEVFSHITDSLYESLPELDPFEKNSVVTQPLREFYVNIEDTGSSTN